MKKTVRIYHLKQCLDDHLNARGSAFSAQGPLLPVDLLEETIWTLNLLFREDKATARLLEEHRGHKRFRVSTPHHLERDRRPLDLNMSDWTGSDRRPLDSDAYRYRGERLLELLEIYEEGPSTLREYLAYEKPYQILNWVWALVASIALALIFGLVSSIAAIISTNATLRALAIFEAVRVCLQGLFAIRHVNGDGSAS